jgi:hypothetical protein
MDERFADHLYSSHLPGDHAVKATTPTGLYIQIKPYCDRIHSHLTARQPQLSPHERKVYILFASATKGKCLGWLNQNESGELGFGPRCGDCAHSQSRNRNALLLPRPIKFDENIICACSPVFPDNRFIETCCTSLPARTRTVLSICCPIYSFYTLTLTVCSRLLDVHIPTLCLFRALIIPYNAIEFIKLSTRTTHKSIINTPRYYGRRPRPIILTSRACLRW